MQRQELHYNNFNNPTQAFELPENGILDVTTKHIMYPFASGLFQNVYGVSVGPNGKYCFVGVKNEAIALYTANQYSSGSANIYTPEPYYKPSEGPPVQAAYILGSIVLVRELYLALMTVSTRDSA